MASTSKNTMGLQGDINTKFFHSCTSVAKVDNIIGGVQKDGIIYNDRSVGFWSPLLVH